MEAKKIVIPIFPLGANVWDRPQPKSMGAVLRRTVAIGTPLPCYGVFKMADGVRYAWLVPVADGKQEWMRVEEPGTVYAIEVDTDTTPSLVDAIFALISQIKELIGILQK